MNKINDDGLSLSVSQSQEMLAIVLSIGCNMKT